MRICFSAKRALTLSALLLAWSAGGITAAQAAEDHLSLVKQRGMVLCGTDNVTPGFGYLDTKTGKMEGVDVDYCRATAAAVLGDPNKVKYVIVTDQSRFNALKTGQVDVVFAHTTVTTSREAQIGVAFLPTVFYDGTGVMVKKSLKVDHVSGLNGATVCITQGSQNEVMWANLIKTYKWNSSTKVVTYQDTQKLFAALSAGRCDAMSVDKSALAGWKGNAPDPAAYVILPETLDKSPLAGFVAADDPKWATALRWMVYATFEAEDLGITDTNLASFVSSKDPYIQAFLGVNGNFATSLGLTPDFVQNVIKSVGNYGTIYDRNLGPTVPWAIERKGSLSASWKQGGMIYSPPWY